MVASVVGPLGQVYLSAAQAVAIVHSSAVMVEKVQVSAIVPVQKILRADFSSPFLVICVT